MPKSSARRVVDPVATAAVTVGTIASIWWFALKPRRQAKKTAITNEKKSGQAAPSIRPGRPPGAPSGTDPLHLVGKAYWTAATTGPMVDVGELSPRGQRGL